MLYITFHLTKNLRGLRHLDPYYTSGLHKYNVGGLQPEFMVGMTQKVLQSNGINNGQTARSSLLSFRFLDYITLQSTFICLVIQ